MACVSRLLSASWIDLRAYRFFIAVQAIAVFVTDVTCVGQDQVTISNTAGGAGRFFAKALK